MNNTRRRFIRNSAITTAGLSTLPGILNRTPLSASDKLVVGVIGVNGMGFNNLKTFLEFPEVECAALCDVDSNVLEKRARETEEISGKKPALYKDYRKMLEQKD